MSHTASPIDIETLSSESGDNQTNEGITRRDFVKRAAIAAAMFAIGGSGLEGCASSAAGKSNETNTTDNTANTDTTTTPETTTNPETVPTVASLEIPSNLTPEQTARTIVDRMNTLENTGMNLETYKLYHSEFMKGKVDSKWEANYIAPYLDAYFTALCGPDYKSNTNLEWFVKQYSAMALTHMQYYDMTMEEDYPQTGKGTGGLAVYQYSETFGKLIFSDSDTLTIGTHEVDNALKTNLPNTPNKIDPNRENYGIMTYKFKTVTGASGQDVLRITGVSYQSTNSNYQYQ